MSSAPALTWITRLDGDDSKSSSRGILTYETRTLLKMKKSSHYDHDNCDLLVLIQLNRVNEVRMAFEFLMASPGGWRVTGWVEPGGLNRAGWTGGWVGVIMRIDGVLIRFFSTPSSGQVFQKLICMRHSFTYDYSQSPRFLTGFSSDCLGWGKGEISRDSPAH